MSDGRDPGFGRVPVTWVAVCTVPQDPGVFELDFAATLPALRVCRLPWLLALATESTLAWRTEKTGDEDAM